MERHDTVAKFAVVIPSKKLNNLLPCLKAITSLEEGDFTVHIVNSGFDIYEFWKEAASIDMKFNVWVHLATLPFIFAQTVNVAVRRSTKEIIVVMNDDAILQTKNGLSKLAASVKNNQEYGVISSGVIGAACNGNILVPQRAHATVSDTVQDAGKMVPFICVAFRRSVYSRVGGMDERYADYGFEDDDFCRSARTAGWKIGVLKSVAVNHETLPSTYRQSGNLVSLEPNRLRYIQKWGNHEGV